MMLLCARPRPQPYSMFRQDNWPEHAFNTHANANWVRYQVPAEDLGWLQRVFKHWCHITRHGEGLFRTFRSVGRVGTVPYLLAFHGCALERGNPQRCFWAVTLHWSSVFSPALEAFPAPFHHVHGSWLSVTGVPRTRVSGFTHP